MDPLTIALIGSSALGGLAQGQAQAQGAKQSRRQQGLTEGQSAVGLQSYLDTLPLRDRAAYLISQRLGVSPQAFQASPYAPDQFRDPSAGAMQQMQQANAAYTPGAGGLDPSVAQELLRRLGYGATAEPKRENFFHRAGARDSALEVR